MTDFDGVRNRATYGGVLTQTYASIGISLFCLTLTETLLRLPRKRSRGFSGDVTDDYLHAIERSLQADLITEQDAENLRQLRSREAHITSYLYLGRCWSVLPSPPHPKWPLQWVFQVLNLSDDHFFALCGVDAAVYIRFLRGCFYFTLLHVCTTLVVILPIHYLFATPDLKRSDINRGSIGSISNSQSSSKAVRLLWVNMAMLFWISVTWFALLAWFLVGVLRFRAIAARNAPASSFSHRSHRNDEDKAADSVTERQEIRPARKTDVEPDYSLRCRTVLVTNIPQYMRSELELKEYFREFLPRVTLAQNSEDIISRIFNRGNRKITSKESYSRQQNSATELGPYPHDKGNEYLIEKVVIVRKLSTLAKLVAARERDLEDLENAHIALARNVIRAVRHRIQQVQHDQRLHGDKDKSNSISRVFRTLIIGKTSSAEDNTAIDKIVEIMQPIIDIVDRRNEYYSIQRRLWHWFLRILRIQPHALQHDRCFDSFDGIWDILFSIPRDMLLPYQPQTRIRHASIFLLPFNLIIDLIVRWAAPNRRPWVERLPTTDLTFSRLKMHTEKIKEFHARDPQTVPPSSSAFVTFRRWQDARRAIHGLPHHAWRPLTCIVQPAPQYEDVDWRRLVRGKFPAQFLRDWIVAAFVWLFQVFWIIPITGIVALVSVDNLTAIIPGLGDFFSRHSKIQATVTGLLPTLIVVLFGILVPVILYFIGRKGQTEVTWSGLHDGILVRYYKWAIINLVLFFCIGKTAIDTILNNIRREIPDPFLLVAQSFPAAAPFYAGWFILQTSVQSAMQLGLVGLPLLQYIFSAHNAGNPRKRMRLTRPRTIDYHYWLPNHLLAIHIVLIFAVLNPLVIPVALVYFACANIVFRNQLLRVYARRLYEGNGKVLAIRILRFSLDGLALAQIVFLAFNLLRVQNPLGRSATSDKVRAALSGSLFGITIIAKIVGTRIFRARYERVEDAENARVSGQEELFFESPKHRDSETEEVSPANLRPASSQAHTRHSTNDILNFRTPTDARVPMSVVPLQTSMYIAKNPFEALRRQRARIRKQKHRSSISALLSEQLTVQPHDNDEEDGDRMGSMDSADEASLSSNAMTRRESRHGRMILQAPLKFAQQIFPRPSTSRPSGEPSNDFIGDEEPEVAVTVHPVLLPWDDTPDSSKPYDNPYYDSLTDFLWLPRDPFTTVDLDDTVELRRVLLSTLREDDGLENEAQGDMSGLSVVPEVAQPDPVLLSRTSEYKSPRLSASSEVAPSQIRHGLSPGSTTRRATTSTEILDLSLPRRPSIGYALNRSSTRSTGRIPSGERVPGSLGISTMFRSENFLSTAPDAISVSGTSAFSRRSSGQSGHSQSRLRPSWQTRAAVEDRVREESEREDHHHRREGEVEEAEDVSAERRAAQAWTVLRRTLIARR